MGLEDRAAAPVTIPQGAAASTFTTPGRFWCDKADFVKINSLKAAYFPLTLSNYYLNFPLTVITRFRGPSFFPEHASAGFRLRAETMGLWHAMPLQPALRFALPCPQRC
jgi:hypothetical protein